MGHSSACRRVGIIGALFSILLVLGTGFAHAAPDTSAAPACDISGAAVTRAFAGSDKNPRNTVSLGDIVTVEGKNLAKLFDKACGGRQVVLFMENWPLKDVKPLPPTNPSSDTLKFKLVNRHYEASSENPWLPILGRPGLDTVPVHVSVGFDNGYGLQADKTAAQTIADQKDPLELKLQVLAPGLILFWGAIFLVMVAVFWWLAQYTTVLRDPAPAVEGESGPFSLSRAQGALWFFVILAAYLFIGITTGDFSDSINSTALILLGIGAGTVLGSAAIDAQKATGQNQRDTVTAIADVRKKLNESVTQVGALNLSLRRASPGSAAFTALDSQQAEAAAQLERLRSQMKKLRGISENFLTDILSDANGISFHRYQIAVWTIVLVVIFIVEVWQNLAMPTFNTTLMGLLGLSAGTYLGLKIPEAVVPNK